MRWRRVFPGEDPELSNLRRWVASLLPACPARDDLILLANELGTNAIRHTASGRGGSFTVEIAWREPTVRIAVSDNGGPGEPRVIDDPLGEQGRGLLLVRSLAASSGMAGDERGRTVWATIPWDGAAPVAAADAEEAAVRDGEAVLAREFTGVMAWFGRATREWWAMPSSGRLVSARTARELAGLLRDRGYGAPLGAARGQEPAGGVRRARVERKHGAQSQGAGSDRDLREDGGGASGERCRGPSGRASRTRSGAGRAVAGRPQFALAPLSLHGEVA
jgi:anti-sigma regulatory factor (Ser/Thr protein kinase)